MLYIGNNLNRIYNDLSKYIDGNSKVLIYLVIDFNSVYFDNTKLFKDIVKVNGEKKENIFESVGLGKYYEMPKNYFYMIYIDEESLKMRKNLLISSIDELYEIFLENFYIDNYKFYFFPNNENEIEDLVKKLREKINFEFLIKVLEVLYKEEVDNIIYKNSILNKANQICKQTKDIYNDMTVDNNLELNKNLHKLLLENNLATLLNAKKFIEEEERFKIFSYYKIQLKKVYQLYLFLNQDMDILKTVFSTLAFLSKHLKDIGSQNIKDILNIDLEKNIDLRYINVPQKNEIINFIEKMNVTLDETLKNKLDKSVKKLIKDFGSLLENKKNVKEEEYFCEKLTKEVLNNFEKIFQEKINLKFKILKLNVLEKIFETFDKNILWNNEEIPKDILKEHKNVEEYHKEAFEMLKNFSNNKDLNLNKISEENDSLFLKFFMKNTKRLCKNTELKSFYEEQIFKYYYSNIKKIANLYYLAFLNIFNIIDDNELKIQGIYKSNIGKYKLGERKIGKDKINQILKSDINMSEDFKKGLKNLYQLYKNNLSYINIDIDIHNSILLNNVENICFKNLFERFDISNIDLKD